MPKRDVDRIPSPSLLPLCGGCGAPVTATPGMLRARHNVCHAEWELTCIPDDAQPIIAAYRELEFEYGQLRRRLDARICDLEEQLSSAQWDLKVAGELAEDLKADLSACQEGRSS